ncbi:hypothetical protein [Spiroplasma endosymbiont of Glossina fuscipes fuscipes]|uniref:hypothetical protein n=1 Tax=Spiroplasma endosymbiont of Glossina fuscipes fuscipes TaxID=2004463 RepID=UPI003C72DCFB
MFDKKQYKEWIILSKYLSWDEIFRYFKRVYDYKNEEQLNQTLNNYLNNLPIKDIKEYEREILNVNVIEDNNVYVVIDFKKEEENEYNRIN